MFGDRTSLWRIGVGVGTLIVIFCFYCICLFKQEAETKRQHQELQAQLASNEALQRVFGKQAELDSQKSQERTKQYLREAKEIEQQLAEKRAADKAAEEARALQPAPPSLQLPWSQAAATDVSISEDMQQVLINAVIKLIYDTYPDVNIFKGPILVQQGNKCLVSAVIDGRNAYGGPVRKTLYALYGYDGRGWHVSKVWTD
jgi:hypothetical protein